jgi:uncharacterized protein YndB with AHSA1/START domain
MKILKITGIVIIALIIILLVIAVILPKKVKIEQSVIINAPVEAVYPNISHFKEMEAWSPWRDYDPNMKITYKGEDGKVGAIYMWKGNKDVGSGQQEIVSMKKNQRVDIKLTFFEPWKSESDIYYTLNEVDPGETKVVWGYTEETPIPKNLMFTLFGLKKSLKKEFDKGLARLKIMCEN